MLGHVRSVSESGRDLVPSELVILLDLLDPISRGKPAQDRRHIYPGTLMQGLPKRTAGSIAIPGKTSIKPPFKKHYMR